MEVLHKYLPKILTSVVLIIVLFLAFWIRIQGADQIPDEQFTGVDPYLYRWQALTISDKGYLPARDMHRWLPLGRDNRQLLSFFSYAIAYTHKAVGWISPKLTLYHIQLYAPPVCWTLGLCVLLLFLTRAYGLFFAASVGVLLATLPGSIARSTVGFSDRDAFCWMLAVLSITSYLWKEQMTPGKRRYIATAVSGFIVFLGGLSWETFGVFVLIIIAAECWKFCTTETEADMKEYLLWVLMFVPGLFLISPAYRSGYGFSKHITAIMLSPPLALLALRGIRYGLLTYVESLRPHARKLALGLTGFSIAAGLCYILLQSPTYEMTAFVFRESRLMQTIGELNDPNLGFWQARYGIIFALGSLGLVLGSRTLKTPTRLSVDIPLIFFFLTTFFREITNSWIGNVWCDRLFFASIGLTCVALGLTCLKRTVKEKDKNEIVMLAVIVWFLLWVSLSRTGHRYDLFIGVPLAYGTAWLLWEFFVPLLKKLIQKIPVTLVQSSHQWISTGITTFLLLSILFWAPLGGHANYAIAATKLRSAVPGDGDLKQAFQWLKENTQNAVVGTTWEYGIQLNVFSGAKNIIDTDHYLQHWVHLYCRHVFSAQSEVEALSFLKTHNATHLFFANWEITSRASDLSFIGSNATDDRQFRFHEFEQSNNPTEETERLTLQEAPLAFIDISAPTSEKRKITAQFRDNTTVEREIDLQPEAAGQMIPIDLENGGILLYFDAKKQIQGAQYLLPVGWNSLAVKLYFRQAHSTAFVPVYPVDAAVNADVKIWEIHYPPDIKTDEKYLATEPEDTDESRNNRK
ncbi:hypothetical protein C6501_10060 [Candidatus Poribacteria bacterium]|nr:MAG: hypothetical protein C6501_10060 [Candidatus Poribacteria bacterium]